MCVCMCVCTEEREDAAETAAGYSEASVTLSFDDGTRKGGGAHLRDGLQLRIPEERPRDGLGVAAAVHGLQAGAGSGV